MSADPLLSQPDIFAPELPDVPYPGLRPFEKHEWPIFFGRERATQEVVDLLLERSLVVIHGSSGCGKSSFIRAGVLSRLEQEHARSGIAWRTCTMRPGDAPTYNLAREFACLGSGQMSTERIQKIRRLVARGSKAVGVLAEAVAATRERRVCLLVDQFEELFRFARETSREQAALLADFLVGLVQTPPPGLYVIITMRSEFLGHCAQFTGLAETINRSQYLLPSMERTALLQAIREPAKLYGGEVDRLLADRLIADAAGAQDTLSLIQHALMLFWNQATAQGDAPRRLGLDLSRKQEGGIAALLSDHADRVMAATVPDPPQQTVVEWLFRALTDINAEGQGIRRPQRFDRLVAVTGCDRELLRRIINAFRTDGVSFLTPYPPEPIEDATVIDISHEALIRCWRRIADPKDGWLQREFQDGLIWRSLLALVDSFEKNPKDVLSPALTEDRRVWLQGRPPAWCERYGGGWQRATELIRASEAAASKARQRETFWQSFLVVIPKIYELFNEFMVFEVAFVSPYRRKLDMVPDFGRDYSLHIKSVFYDEWKWLITYYENRIASHAADLRSTHWNDIHQVLHKMVELGGDTHELLVNTEKLWVQLTTEILRCDQIINGFNRLAADDEMSEHYDGNWRDIYLKIYASFYMFESCMIKVRMLLFNLLRTLNNVQQLWIV